MLRRPKPEPPRALGHAPPVAALALLACMLLAAASGGVALIWLLSR
jgi:hypothetical protein